MRHQDRWKPSKFVFRRGRLRASRDTREVAAGSRLIADLVAERYGEHLPRHARGRLLDLGCGSVPFYEAYRGHVAETVCVDWANTLHNRDYIDHVCDLTGPLDFASDAAFDTVILSDVLEHLPNPEHLMGEVARVMAPDGKLLLNVPFYYFLHEMPHDYYRYTEFALRRFVETSGLKLLHLEAIGGAPEILADLLAKLLASVPLVGRTSAVAVQAVARAFVRLPPGRRISRKTAQRFPLGYFLIAEK